MTGQDLSREECVQPPVNILRIVVHFNRVDFMVHELYLNKAVVFLKGLPGLIQYDSIYLKFKNGQKWSVVIVFRTVGDLGCRGATDYRM